MFTRFTHITNNLKSLGKTYNNEEMIRKILRYLPKNKRGPKVTAIEEAQDLRKLALDDLLRKILTRELSFLDEDDYPPSMKNIALKAKQEQEDSSDNEDGDEDEVYPFALIIRGLSNVLILRKHFKKQYPSKFHDNKKGNKFSLKRSNNMSCFGCGSTNHFIKECPVANKKNMKQKFKNKSKKALVATWSDDDSSDEDDSGSDEEQTTNACLMAKIDSNHEDGDNDNEENNEITSEKLSVYPKELLVDALVNCMLS